jgi:hypothetical protein
MWASERKLKTVYFGTSVCKATTSKRPGDKMNRTRKTSTLNIIHFGSSSIEFVCGPLSLKALPVRAAFKYC